MQENVELYGMKRLHFRHSAGLPEVKPAQSLSLSVIAGTGKGFGN
jgi:hypothetical protein